MTYGALNTVTTADVEHAREAISDVRIVNHLLVIFTRIIRHCILYIFDVVSSTC